MRLYVLGLGLAGQLLRGGGGGRGAAARRGLQRPRDRAPGGGGGAGSVAGGGHRAHPRARRPRLRRGPAGPAARRSGAHRAGHLGPAGGARCGAATIGPLGLARRGRAGPVPRRGLPHQPRCRGAAGARRPRPATAPASGVAYDLGRPTTAVRYLLRNLTRDRAGGQPRRDRSSGPAAIRRWCSAGSPDRAAICPIGPRPSCWPSCTTPGLAVVVLAHLSQRCNTADDARATVAPALRRVGLRGIAPRRRAGRAAAGDRPVASGAGAAQAGALRRRGGRADGRMADGRRTGGSALSSRAQRGTLLHPGRSNGPGMRQGPSLRSG